MRKKIEKFTALKSNNKPRWGLIGAVISAILASICCIGPLILLGLGISGAWIGNLSTFEPYRPIFMLITLGFLGFAFYKAYSKPKSKECKTGSYCANLQSDKITKITLWSVTILIVGMLVFPIIVPFFTSNDTTTQFVSTKRVTLNIEGMTCAGCSVTVTKSLKRLKGVQKANVTLNPPKAIIFYNPDIISIKQLVEATTQAGYPSSIEEGK